MNVIVGRHSNGEGGDVLDKFSLYYSDNAAMNTQYNNTWPLLQGYSFRTACLAGTLNRDGLSRIQTDEVGADNGLVIDDNSKEEDCAYVEIRPGESDNKERRQRIEKIVSEMVTKYNILGLLAKSYDPIENEEGLTALQSEWNLLKRILDGSS